MMNRNKEDTNGLLKKIVEEQMEFQSANIKDILSNHNEPSVKTVKMIDEVHEVIGKHKVASERRHEELKEVIKQKNNDLKDNLKESNNWMKWAFGVVVMAVLGSGVVSFFTDKYHFNIFKETITNEIVNVHDSIINHEERITLIEDQLEELIK